MGDPIVFISRRTARGSPRALGEAVRQAASMIARDKPGTVAFLPYVSDDGDEPYVVHVSPDADASRAHPQGVNERVAAAAEVIETLGYEIYGSPDGHTVETMRGFATRQGVPLTVRPRSIGGYLRPVRFNRRRDVIVGRRGRRRRSDGSRHGRTGIRRRTSGAT